MDISITIDETANGQTIYCKELDSFLQVYIIPAARMLADLEETKKKTEDSQKKVDDLSSVLFKRQETKG